MPRYFIGITPPDEVASIITDAQRRAQNLARAHYGHREVPVSHGRSPLHITLVEPFEAEDEHAVEQAVRETLGDLEPFELELSGLGYFEPHTVYATVRKSEWPPLLTLREALLLRLASIPFVIREFRPHLSLARKFRESDFGIIRRCLIEATARQSARQPVAVFPQRFEVRGLTLFVQRNGAWTVLGPERRAQTENAA